MPIWKLLKKYFLHYYITNINVLISKKSSNKEHINSTKEIPTIVVKF